MHDKAEATDVIKDHCISTIKTTLDDILYQHVDISKDDCFYC